MKAGSRRGPGPQCRWAQRPITPLCKASRVAVQYREKVKEVQSRGQNCSSLDMKADCGGANRIEQRGLGRGHPHLPAAFEAGEQGGTTIGVEMRGDLVQKKDWRLAATLGHQL